MNGSAAEVTLVVGEEDTAIALGSGDVPVLATPRLLALAEQAAVAAIANQLMPSQTSVGIHAEIHHVKATRVGQTVVVRSEVLDVNDRGLTFEFSVTEGSETVAYGSHKRVLVERDRFPS
jgi:predicted thioesterase